MRKLGILVNNLTASQLAYCLISRFNPVCLQQQDLDFITFYENYDLPCITPQFPTMQIYEAWGYNAPLIATSLTNVTKLINFPSAANKYFYVWDLEWIRIPDKQFNFLAPIYAHDSLKLIARNDDHAKIIENCWNVKIHAIIEDVDPNKILEIISE